MREFTQSSDLVSLLVPLSPLMFVRPPLTPLVPTLSPVPLSSAQQHFFQGRKSLRQVPGWNSSRETENWLHASVHLLVHKKNIM